MGLSAFCLCTADSLQILADQHEMVIMFKSSTRNKHRLALENRDKVAVSQISHSIVKSARGGNIEEPLNSLPVASKEKLPSHGKL